MGRDMPCGLCCVCDEPVDHSEAGFCRVCGGAFHWRGCGGWSGMQHVCDECETEDKDDE